jgi:PAS domain S-box-containing protein
VNGYSHPEELRASRERPTGGSPRGRVSRAMRLGARYGAAIAAVAMATGLSSTLQDDPGTGVAHITMLAAAALVAIALGGGPGVMATALGAAAIVWLLPAGGAARGALSIGLFVASGLLVSAASELLRRHRRTRLTSRELGFEPSTAEGEFGITGCGRIGDDRKRSATALKLSDERLRKILEYANTGIVITDWNGRFQVCNPVYCNLLGYTRDELREMEFASIIHPDDREAHLALIRRLKAGEVPSFEIEDRYVRKDGQSVWIRKYVSVLHDSSGVPAHLVALVTDVTERNRAAETLRRREELQRAILASLAPHIAVLDRTGSIVAVNPAWESFARDNGGSPERTGVGVNYLAICEAAAGTGAAEAIRAAEGIRAVLDGTMEEFSLEYPCDSESKQLWFLLQATPLLTAGGGVVVSHREITDQRRAEAELRNREARLSAILNTASDAIITIDRQGMIESINPATVKLFGYAPEEMVGRNVRMLMPAPFYEEHDSYMARYLQTGESRIIGHGREVTARRKDGSVFPIDLAVSEIDHRQLFTGIIRDATRRKELEREVVEIASLEQRRIGQDLHDTVGQELTALRILTDDLPDAIRTDPASAAAFVERIARGLKRCQRELRIVIRGLLPVAVDKQGLMVALAELADRTGQDGKLVCTFDCRDPVEVSDNLTATHLYRIAQEAVRNAVKHASPRNIRISLSVDQGLILQVQDDGVGPPSSAQEGKGVGLRIMRNRAAIIGATLKIERVEPSGTLVTCHLPRMNHVRG